MKYVFSALIIIGLCIHVTVTAQVGWKWGITCIDISMPYEYGLMAMDRQGNVFAGVTPGPTIFGTIYSTKPFIAKVDSAGNYLWVAEAHAYPVSIVTDKLGNAYVLALYYGNITIGSFTLSGPDMFATYAMLTKISPTGSIIWAKTVTSGVDYFQTGFGFNYLGLDGIGNIYMSGMFKKPDTLTIGTTSLVNADLLNETQDVFIAKFDTSGNPLWAKSIKGNGRDYVFGLAVTESGNIYISGDYASDSFGTAGAFLKGIARPDDTSFIFNPHFEGNYLAKFNTVGNLLWLHNLDRHELITTIITDVNENIFVTGYIDSNLVLGTDTLLCPDGKKSAFFGKYNSQGDYKWAINSPYSGSGTLDDIGYSLSADLCGNIWVAGGMKGNMIFSGHPLSYPPGSTEPTFLVEYDTSGNYQYSMTITGGGEDAMSIAVDNRGNLFMVGDYWNDSIIFNTDTLKPHGVYEGLFIAKYNYQAVMCPGAIKMEVPCEQPIVVPEITLYPNPTSDEFTINLEHMFSPGTQAWIYDLSGRLVNSYTLSGNKTVISVAGIAPGIYQFRIISGDGNVITKKLSVLR